MRAPSGLLLILAVSGCTNSLGPELGSARIVAPREVSVTWTALEPGSSPFTRVVDFSHHARVVNVGPLGLRLVGCRKQLRDEHPLWVWVRADEDVDESDVERLLLNGCDTMTETVLPPGRSVDLVVAVAGWQTWPEDWNRYHAGSYRIAMLTADGVVWSRRFVL